MTISTRRHSLSLIAATSILLLSLTQPAMARPSTSPATAVFNGATIDLTQDWGRATACTSDGVRTDCFGTEGQMDQFLLRQATITANCSSSLRLYSNSGFTGSVLNLTARGFWLNLSSYGFDNVTSSYVVGACDSVLASGAGGGGSWYPGPTGAFASASSMLSGWNDVISSAYIA